MWPSVTHPLVVLLGLSLVAIGLIAQLAPGLAATFYGVEARTLPALVFVRAAGARDMVVGGILIYLLVRRVENRTLGIVLLIATLIPIVDALGVLQASGMSPAFILHAGSILPILILAIALIAGRDA